MHFFISTICMSYHWIPNGVKSGSKPLKRATPFINLPLALFLLVDLTQNPNKTYSHEIFTRSTMLVNAVTDDRMAEAHMNIMCDLSLWQMLRHRKHEASGMNLSTFIMNTFLFSNQPRHCGTDCITIDSRLHPSQASNPRDLLCPPKCE